MTTKEIKIENKFPNHQFDEVIVTKNGITVVYFKVNRGDDIYRFFVNNNEELDRRLLDHCRTLTIKERHLKHAIVGIWEHIDFLLANPDWVPAPFFNWVDRYNFECPHCGAHCNVNNTKTIFPTPNSTGDIREVEWHYCDSCNTPFSERVEDELFFYIDEGGGEAYERHERRYNARLAKIEELEHRANGYNDFNLSRQYIGERVRELRQERGIAQVHMAEALGVSIPTIKNIELGSKSYRCSTLFDVLAHLGATLTLTRAGEVVSVSTNVDMAEVLRGWRGDATLYSLAKNTNMDWRRFRDIENCQNYGIDHLIAYMKALGVIVTI